MVSHSSGYKPDQVAEWGSRVFLQMLLLPQPETMRHGKDMVNPWMIHSLSGTTPVWCRDGNGYFEGDKCFLEILKVQKNKFSINTKNARGPKQSEHRIFDKYKESTRTSIFGQLIGDSSKNIFVSLGFAYDFPFCQDYGSLKILQTVFWEMSSKNAKRHQSFRFLGGGFLK